MDSLLSFPVGLFHPLQHAGLSRRSPVCRQTRSRLDYPSPFDKRQNGSVHGKIHAHGIC
jgi:hypothetical protein